MKELSRLSPYNIESSLIQAELYREIRTGQSNRTDWTSYVIQPDEVLRPELAAYRHYGQEGLKWLVLVATGLDDIRDELVAGETIYLPPLAWIRQRIIYYQEKERGL